MVTFKQIDTQGPIDRHTIHIIILQLVHLFLFYIAGDSANIDGAVYVLL